jgi:hypothetical protein
MPSRPLSADTKAVVKLQTRLDNEAMDITKGRTDIPAAVARLTQLIPPARVDLVDEVLVRVGRRDLDHTRDWPPVHLVHQLASGSSACTLERCACAARTASWVDVIRYRDKMQQDRRCYRLTRHGVFVGEYKTPEELGKVVDLGQLVEERVGDGGTGVGLLLADVAGHGLVVVVRVRVGGLDPVDVTVDVSADQVGEHLGVADRESPSAAVVVVVLTGS